jgi:hypothetical protein
MSREDFGFLSRYGYLGSGFGPSHGSALPSSAARKIASFSAIVSGSAASAAARHTLLGLDPWTEPGIHAPPSLIITRASTLDARGRARA